MSPPKPTRESGGSVLAPQRGSAQIPGRKGVLCILSLNVVTKISMSNICICRNVCVRVCVGDHVVSESSS